MRRRSAAMAARRAMTSRSGSGMRMATTLLLAICVARCGRSIDAKRRPVGRPCYNSDKSHRRPRPPASALAGLEARVRLVDDVDPALAAHDAAVLVPFLG